MNNTPMTSREAFEAWFLGPNIKRSLERDDNGSYKYVPANQAWEAWQASQAQQAQTIAELKEDLLDLRTQVNYRCADVQRLTELNNELVEALEMADEAMMWGIGGEPIPSKEIEARAKIKEVLSKVKGK